MNADEMFKKLGYKNDIEASYGTIRFNKDYNSFINFIIDDKCVLTNTLKNNQIDMLYITMEELQAIIKKCEELKWL